MDEYGEIFSQLVAAELRAERGRKKITIDSLVKATGVSKSAVLNYLNGKRDAPTSALVALARALSVDPHELFIRAERAYRPEDYALAASEDDYDQEADGWMESK